MMIINDHISQQSSNVENQSKTPNKYKNNWQ